MAKYEVTIKTYDLKAGVTNPWYVTLTGEELQSFDLSKMTDTEHVIVGVDTDDMDEAYLTGYDIATEDLDGRFFTISVVQVDAETPNFIMDCLHDKLGEFSLFD